MIFVETQFYKAWEAYDDETQKRFYSYAHSLILLLVYEILIFLSFNPKVYNYNGVDLWFKVSQILPKGTLFISLILIGLGARTLYLDWMGKKTRKEQKKDWSDGKKNPRFKPKSKNPFRPNWYYFGMQIVEGLVWGSLMLMILPYLTFGLLLPLSAGSPGDLHVFTGSAFDANDVLRNFHTNFFLNIGLAFGAGFYEELIFRGFLFAGLARLVKQYKWLSDLKAESVTVDVFNFSLPKFNPKDRGFLLVILVGTTIYVLTHYLMPFGDTLNFYNFSYRFLYGLIMYYLFYRRRFVIAAWTHVFYDLWYFILL